jgi:hypothetical protein
VITGILCGFNLFVVLYSLSKLFDSSLSALIILTFLLTYLLPPLLFDFANTWRGFVCTYVPSVVAYLLAMPLYLIVFQVYSYANLHDVSWGNREASPDQSLQQMQKRAEELRREKALKKVYKINRVFIFMLWIFANLMAGYIMSQFRKRNMTWFLVTMAYCLVIF